MFFAQINDEMICVGVSELSGKKPNDNLIEIEHYDTSLIGKKYLEGGGWEDVELETIAEEPGIQEQILFEIQYQTTLLEMGGI